MNKGIWLRSLGTGLLLLGVVFAIAQNLEEALRAELARKGIPGISLSVIQGSRAETTVVGLADPDLDIPLEPQHRMLAGSIGKTFYATVILQLVEEGRLSLEAKAADYLGAQDWFMTLPNASTLTIRSLMNHTSGIPEYVYAEALWQRIKAEPVHQWSAAERLSFIAEQEPLFPVGAGWAYADANYIILGAIVEAVTGEDIYELVQQRILAPCRLTQTEPATQAQLDNLTAAYTGRLFGDLFGEKVSEMGQYGLNPQFEWTGGGMVSNSADLARWAQCFYGGSLMATASHTQLFAPVNRQTGAAGGRTGYGLGTEIFATSYGLAYGHTGFMPGYLSLMAYLPDYDLAIAFQLNTDPYSSRVVERFSVFDLLEVILPYYLKRNRAYGAKTTLYLVRHAEKAADGTRDPALNAAGQARAEHLAAVLADKGIDAIYSTPFQRTVQTGAPLAAALNQPIYRYAPTYMTHIFDFIANHQGQQILVIGHSNTIPAMINWVLRKAELDQLEEQQYGDVFILQHKKGKARLAKSKF